MIDKSTVHITIKGRPISKDNEKFFNRRSGRPFTSARFKDYEENVRLQAAAQMIGKPPIEGDIMMMMVFWFQNRTRPDLFNAPKSIADALQGIVYQNDKQVTIGYLQCLYDNANPRVEVYVDSIENGISTKTVRKVLDKSSKRGCDASQLAGNGSNFNER